MAQARARPKLTVTVDADTTPKLNRLVDTRKAKNIGYAVDMVTNHYFLTSSAEMQKMEERREQMEKETIEKGKVVINEALQEAMTDLEARLTKALERLVHIEIEHTMKLDALRRESEEDTGPPMDPEMPALTFEQLLAKVPGSNRQQVEDWAAGWEEEIAKSGHSVDEFVAAKMMQIQRTAVAMTKATERQEKPVEKVGEIDGVARGLVDKMNDHWRTMNGEGGMRSADTTRFYVAFQAVKYNKALSSQDNGHKQEKVEHLLAQLNQAAIDRRFPVEEYMTEFDYIYSHAIELVDAVQKGGLK